MLPDGRDFGARRFKRALEQRLTGSETRESSGPPFAHNSIAATPDTCRAGE
jgi:hypothetical protein